jgi:hypothetical protein
VNLDLREGSRYRALIGVSTAIASQPDVHAVLHSISVLLSKSVIVLSGLEEGFSEGNRVEGHGLWRCRLSAIRRTIEMQCRHCRLCRRH